MSMKYLLAGLAAFAFCAGLYAGPPAGGPPPPPPEAVVEVAAEPARPTVQEVSKTLEALTEEPKAVPAAAEEAAAEKKAVEENKKLEEANAKLNDLLGNRK